MTLFRHQEDKEGKKGKEKQKNVMACKSSEESNLMGRYDQVYMLMRDQVRLGHGFNHRHCWTLI